METSGILELVKQAQAGSTEAFAQIYEQFAQRIFRYINLRIRSREQAEDLLQEVFIKVWVARGQFNSKKGSFSAWLYRIAGNVINDYLRRLYRRPEVVGIAEGFDAADDYSLAETFADQVDAESIKKAFVHLSVQHQEVLELLYIQNFDLRQTAKILGRSYLAVRVLQFRALKKLREYLNPKKDAV